MKLFTGNLADLPDPGVGTLKGVSFDSDVYAYRGTQLIKLASAGALYSPAFHKATMKSLDDTEKKGGKGAPENKGSKGAPENK